jgi:branched-chain amino acid transport system permease protein
MLSLAFSMILYGLLVKTSQLGSTDGFGLSVKTFAGIALPGSHARYVIFAFSSVLAFLCAVFMHRYWSSHMGRLATAIRDNELRVEYMGESVRRVIHLNYVIGAAMAGIGGALMAGAIGHVDPETTANWTTSGEFVFIAILGGTGSVFAPFVGAGIFEAVRTFALERFPNTWQMSLGITMLLVMIFLPGGLWSAFRARKRPA